MKEIHLLFSKAIQIPINFYEPDPVARFLGRELSVLPYGLEGENKYAIFHHSQTHSGIQLVNRVVTPGHM